jgi:hypothetical protein
MQIIKVSRVYLIKIMNFNKEKFCKKRNFFTYFLKLGALSYRTTKLQRPTSRPSSATDVDTKTFTFYRKKYIVKNIFVTFLI